MKFMKFSKREMYAITNALAFTGCKQDKDLLKKIEQQYWLPKLRKKAVCYYLKNNSQSTTCSAISFLNRITYHGIRASWVVNNFKDKDVQQFLEESQDE